VRGEVELARVRELHGTAEDRARDLERELSVLDARLTREEQQGPTTAEPLAVLDGLSLLYVGGRPDQVRHLRSLGEDAGATFLHHDGGLEERGGRLAGLVSRADLVLFPVDCVSHQAVSTVKRLCRQSGKPYVPLRSAGVASFLAALGRPEITAAGRYQPA
jgi:hypothetical protein